MTEVISGIYQLQIPIPSSSASLDHVNAYLVQGDNGYLLVDTGLNTEEAFDSFKRQLAEIGVDFKDISQIVITHIHPDHYGLAGRLKHLCRAKVALHYLEKDLIESRYIDMDNLLQQMERWLHINGVPADEIPTLQGASLGMVRFVTPALPDITLRGGETISTGTFNFKVIWTPGHSPGHICLYEPTEKVLVAGDTVLATITPNVGLHTQSRANPLGDYTNSLNRIKNLEVRLTLPGHENIFTHLKPRIKKIMRHHRQRNREILGIIRAEASTAYQVATEVIWKRSTSMAGWQNLGPLDRRLAVLETIAHLESMRFTGKVDKFHRDGIIYYRILDKVK